MIESLYIQMTAARIESDEADRNERLAIDEYGIYSLKYLDAVEARISAQQAYLRARDEWEAAQPYDPVEDFNYVGSRHHY